MGRKVSQAYTSTPTFVSIILAYSLSIALYLDAEYKSIIYMYNRYGSTQDHHFLCNVLIHRFSSLFIVYFVFFSQCYSHPSGASSRPLHMHPPISVQCSSSWYATCIQYNHPSDAHFARNNFLTSCILCPPIRGGGGYHLDRHMPPKTCSPRDWHHRRRRRRRRRRQL